MSGLFTQLKGQLALNRLSEDKLIEIVLEEQKQGEVDEVALAKAKMDAEGDEKKAEALYIKHRIRRIKDSDDANMAIAQSIVQKAEAWHRKNRQNEETVGPWEKTNEPKTNEKIETDAAANADGRKFAAILFFILLLVIMATVIKNLL